MSAPSPSTGRAARLLALAAGLLLVTASGAAAQTGPASLRLRVVDAATGEPLRGARAALLDGHAAVTGTDGAALLEGLAAGARVAEVSHLGYETARVMARLVAGGRAELEVRLTPRPVALDPLATEAEPGPRTRLLRSFYARASTGPGQYITREEIDRVRPRQVSDLLRIVPGMVMISVGMVEAPRMEGMTSAVARRGATGRHRLAAPPGGADCPILYFLDGTPIEVRDGAIDTEVDPREVEGIEIYRRGSNAPAQFRRGDNCGIVLIWKRERLPPPDAEPAARG